MIEIKDVCKRFTKELRKGQGADVMVALENVNLTVNDNEFVCIIGTSGCGKTTLLKIIDGLIKPDSGVVFINGVEVKEPGPDRGFVFQDFALMPWADIITNVAFGLELKGVPKNERLDIAAHWIKAVGLTGFERRHPHELSGGMQQRAGLARALSVDPKILLMDEPFGQVDAQTRQFLQEDLLRLWQKDRKTVMFVTHSMDEAVFLADRVAIMRAKPGRVHEVVSIDLPRPRSEQEVRRSSVFTETASYIWETIKQLSA